MIPVFVGFIAWIGILSLLLSLVFVLFRPLRRWAGFVFLTPVLGAGSAFVGFLIIGRLLDGKLRPELAASIAFYVGFLLCGAIGSILGLVAGFFVWRRATARMARQAASL
jgi:hypothetical protein